MSLELKNLAFGYSKNRKKGFALDNISFALAPGELHALVGQNGSGKSTLLKCINGILKPSGGRIDYQGRDILSLSLKKRAALMSYVPQTIPGSMNFRVFDVVLMGRRPFIRWEIKKRDREAVFSILARMNLENLCFRYYDELSGGQKQKILIARALVQEPEILIMDEATSNLDLKHQLDVLQLLGSIAREQNITVLLSAHDLNLVINHAHQLIMLKKGKICHAGRAAEVLTPSHIKDAFDVDTHVGRHKGTAFVLVNQNSPSGYKPGKNTRGS